MTHERTVGRRSTELQDRLDPVQGSAPGRRTLTSDSVSSTFDAGSSRDAVAPAGDARPAGRVGARSMLDRIFGVGDGIGLSGGSELTDKSQGQAAQGEAMPGALDAKQSEAEEELGEEASGADGNDAEADGGGDDAGGGGGDDEAEVAAAGETTPASGNQSTQGGADAPRPADRLQDQVGGGGGGGGGGGAPPPGPGGGAAATATATIGAINFHTTPAGVGARIPPRKTVRVQVTVTGGPVVLSLDGAGTAGNGTIDGRATKTLRRSGVVTLRGTTQTPAGLAGGLSLIASSGSAVVGRSNAFTICAIPTQVSVRFGGLITGTERGIRMTTYNNSDSGQVSDLDQVQMSEMVQYQGGTGCFAGITSGNNSGYLAANVRPHGTDSHGTPVALMTGAGYIEAVQGFKFQDARSGVADIGVARSGFMITRTVRVSGTRTYLTTHKYGTGTTVSGITVAAGSGSASRRQLV
jgi:hypothetical protein